MENAGYTSLTRQSGLLREMQVVANNIANASTTGYRKEGLLFAEHIVSLENGQDSLSMAHADVRSIYQTQGELVQTNAPFDFAIEGAGFFLVEAADGNHLTRAGSFTPNAIGELTTDSGQRLLDNGGAPIFVPPGSNNVTVSADGTLSADGQPLAQIGVYAPIATNDLSRRSGVQYFAKGGVKPVDDPTMVQGFLEGSNVNAVSEIARMIEVQRAYELGQKLLDKEDERIRGVLQTLGR